MTNIRKKIISDFPKPYIEKYWYYKIWYFFLGIVFGLIIISLFLFLFLKSGKTQPADFKVEIIKENNNKITDAIITGYSPSVDETDDSPFIAASNRRVFEGMIANNCLKFGTRVKINGKIYEVWDRMNKRYSCKHFDIFFWTKAEALKWGRKIMEVEIIEE